MKHYRIFCSAMGQFRDSSKYEFVAEFADDDAVKEYINYLFSEGKHSRKDFIIKTIDVGTGIAEEGQVDGVISAIGESLDIKGYTFI